VATAPGADPEGLSGRGGKLGVQWGPGAKPWSGGQGGYTVYSNKNNKNKQCTAQIKLSTD